MHPLHQDGYGRYSYPELIDFIFGHQILQDTLIEHGLSEVLASSANLDAGAKMAKAVISESLHLKFEHRYSDLESAQSTVTSGCNEMLEHEMFEVIKKVGITVLSKDRMALELYFKTHCSRENGTVALLDMFDYFKVTRRLVQVQLLIMGQFSDHDNAMRANQALQAKSYTFEDLVQFLERAGFDL